MLNKYIRSFKLYEGAYLSDDVNTVNLQYADNIEYSNREVLKTLPYAATIDVIGYKMAIGLTWESYKGTVDHAGRFKKQWINLKMVIL
jgi:hypothetical protein